MKNKIKSMDYSAHYFKNTTKIVQKYKKNTITMVQFFQRSDNVVLAGMEEVLSLLKKNTKYKKYSIEYLKDGTIINNKDVVLQLEGNYEHFGFMENLIDGILSRMTSLATNARKIINVANGKDVIFMGDRVDLYSTQKYDGKAIKIGGINKLVTKEHCKLTNTHPVGTVPHALIAIFEGDQIQALEAYKEVVSKDLIALVDFHNDVINESLKMARHFKDNLKGVRIDTSKALYDKYFEDKENKEYGVNPTIVKALRKALDQEGFNKVKIIVSSGLNVDQIKEFENQNAPVDIYGVGSSLLKINNTFTCDVVKVNGKDMAKTGRSYKKINGEKLI